MSLFARVALAMLCGAAVRLRIIEDSVLCNNEKRPMLREEIGDFIIRLRPLPWSLVHGESLIKLVIRDTLSFCND